MANPSGNEMFAFKTSNGTHMATFLTALMRFTRTIMHQNFQIPKAHCNL